MRRLTCLLVLTAVFCLLAPAQSGLQIIQPDAGVAFGIEWRRMVDSVAGAAFADQFTKSDLSKFPGFQGLQGSLLHDLDSVLIAAPMSSLGKDITQPPALVVVKGRFNLAQLRSLLVKKGQTVESYRAIELLGTPSQPAPGAKAVPDNNRVAFLDANTILAGDRAQIRAAIDRVKSGQLTQRHTGALAGVAELAAANDMWMAFAIPQNSMKDVPAPMGQMLADVRSAEIGMSFQDGLAFRMNVRTKDDDSAKLVAQTLQGLVGMAALSQPQNPQSLDTLKKLKITPEGSQVGITLALDRSELDKMIKEAQATRQAQSSRATVTARPMISGPPPPPERSGPKNIRITGLDSGPIEIPLSDAKK
jgi:hypothetical protein